MKRILAASLTTLAIFVFSTTASAQEEARAAWQITDFNIAANVQQPERVLNVQATLNASNVGRGIGSSFTFRINGKASIKAVTVGGATATFRTVAESYGNLQRVTVTPPSTIPPNSPAVLNISYTLPVE
ncbi:MAG TPA: hypothetical protein DHU55_04410, partial [Blastocatellia bacterium]|nr:hypothetical protein [Blastocatellia bacterium]